MAIDSTSGVGATSNGADNTQKAQKTLGQDAFLKLLVTQLENQDPTSPQDNSQFIAQLATFSSLEKLTEISSQIASLQLMVANQVGTTDASSTSSSNTSKA